MVEAPAGLHAADGVDGAGGCDEGGHGEKYSGAVVGEVREEKGEAEA